MRVIHISNLKDIKQIMQEMRVDKYGIEIMAPKAMSHLVKIDSLSCITADILKQEMLSLGGDVAVAREALTGRIKKTDCLLMGTAAQFNRLKEKLNRQPFGLNQLAKDLSLAMVNYQRNYFRVDLGKYKLGLSQRRPCIMGVINLTPDSFSGDGLYRAPSTEHRAPSIIDFAEKMVNDGANIIDVGGESTHPGARSMTVKEELARTIPIVRKIVKKVKFPISIDTYKPEVARQALDNGASLVNDITGLRNPRMLKVIAKFKAAVVIMHMQGEPRTMQKDPAYKSLIDEIIEFLDKAIKRAINAGINRDKIIIDPGIGFGKTFEHNLEILRQLKELKTLGYPVLIGPSRKSFIGEILDVGPKERVFGTVSACILAVKNGANILRVHDVKEVSQALKVMEAILND